MLAYVACWAELRAAQIAGRDLTHVNYAFACIKDGSVVNFMAANFDRLSANDPALAAQGYAAACAKEEANLGIARELKAAYPHLKLLISVGGWAAEGFSDAALTPESREQFADSAIQFMLTYGFDGVDLDWEYPCSDIGGIKARPEDRENFTLLLALLRRKLDAQSLSNGHDSADSRYLLTIATGAAPDHLVGVDIAGIAPLLDYIGLMTYDLYNGWSSHAGHHANLFDSELDPNGDSADKTVRYFLKAGAPASKLLVGAAFYGRGMTGVGSEHAGLMQPSTPGSNFTRTFDEISNLLRSEPSWKRHWDERAKAPFIYDGDAFISYEDEESLRCKARYVREHGLGGAMFWEYSNNRNGELLRALSQALGA